MVIIRGKSPLTWHSTPVLAILILLAATSIAPRAMGSENTMLLLGDHFTVAWKLNAWQNLTGFPTSNIYPVNLTSTLAGQDLSALTSALQNQFQQMAGTLTVDHVSASITSNSPDNVCAVVCKLQWFNMTISFQVHETPNVSWGDAQYSMSWKGAKIGDDLTVGGIGYNRLGDRYFLPGLEPFVNFQQGSGRNLGLTVAGYGPNNETLEEPTTSIVLLDLSALQSPLQNWHYTRNLFGDLQTWRSPSNAGFSIVAKYNIREPEGTTTLLYVAGERVSAELNTPINTFVRGDTLFVNQSGGFLEKIGLATIIGLLGVLVVSAVLERRITRGYGRPAKRKQSR